MNLPLHVGARVFRRLALPLLDLRAAFDGRVCACDLEDADDAARRCLRIVGARVLCELGGSARARRSSETICSSYSTASSGSARRARHQRALVDRGLAHGGSLDLLLVRVAPRPGRPTARGARRRTADPGERLADGAREPELAGAHRGAARRRRVARLDRLSTQVRCSGRGRGPAAAASSPARARARAPARARGTAFSWPCRPSTCYEQVPPRVPSPGSPWYLESHACTRGSSEWSSVSYSVPPPSTSSSGSAFASGSSLFGLLGPAPPQRLLLLSGQSPRRPLRPAPRQALFLRSSGPARRLLLVPGAQDLLRVSSRGFTYSPSVHALLASRDARVGSRRSRDADHVGHAVLEAARVVARAALSHALRRAPSRAPRSSFAQTLGEHVRELGPGRVLE
jgi:hypothetical protein